MVCLGLKLLDPNLQAFQMCLGLVRRLDLVQTHHRTASGAYLACLFSARRQYMDPHNGDGRKTMRS